jgi:hypothetical protein
MGSHPRMPGELPGIFAFSRDIGGGVTAHALQRHHSGAWRPA